MNEAGAESWSAREPARAQRGAALAGVNREGDGVAALVEVARVGGDDLRFVRRLVARALQVGGDLLVCFVVVPEFGVDVRGRVWADLALRHGMAVPARDLRQHACRERFHPEHVTQR